MGKYTLDGLTKQTQYKTVTNMNTGRSTTYRVDRSKLPPANSFAGLIAVALPFAIIGIIFPPFGIFFLSLVALYFVIDFIRTSIYKATHKTEVKNANLRAKLARLEKKKRSIDETAALKKRISELEAELSTKGK